MRVSKRTNPHFFIVVYYSDITLCTNTLFNKLLQIRVFVVI